LLSNIFLNNNNGINVDDAENIKKKFEILLVENDKE
jgi:hypothetical protein